MSPLIRVGKNLVTLSPEVADALNIIEGNTVRIVPLSSGRRLF
jgi:arginine N-succinyltransferase